MKRISIILLLLISVLSAQAEQKAVVRTHAFGME